MNGLSYSLHSIYVCCFWMGLGHKATAILTFAHFTMANRFGWITIIALFAVVAVATSCCMSTIQANSTGYTARHLIQFHIEAASSRVSITVTSYAERKDSEEEKNAIKIKSKKTVNTPKYLCMDRYTTSEGIVKYKRTSKNPLIYFTWNNEMNMSGAVRCSPHTSCPCGERAKKSKKNQRAKWINPGPIPTLIFGLSTDSFRLFSS